MNATVPLLTGSKKVRKRHKPFRPFWNEELSSLWHNMREKEREFLKCKSGHHKNSKRSAFKIAQSAFDKRYRYLERQHNRSKMDRIDQICTDNPKLFWEELQKLGPKKKTTIPMEVYNDNGDTVSDIDQVLHQWKSDFCDLFSTSFNTDNAFGDSIGDTLTEIERNFNDQPEENPDLSDLNADISLPEIQKLILKAKNNKATGIDGIPYEILKFPPIIHALHRLYKSCFANKLTPSAWKIAVIKPIPKKGDSDPRLPLSYRGISLIATIAKIYSSFLNSRLTAYLNNNDLLADEQNGFRSDRSCEDHIFALNSIIKNRLNAKQSTFAAFIDLRKAFDVVNRNLLLFKLTQIGIGGNFYFAIKSLYNGNCAHVQVNDYLTEKFPTPNGVRQGDTLSPTLFITYINDLAREINLCDSGIKVGNRAISLLMYADDIVLISDSATGLQNLLHATDRWCHKWQMSINTDKSQIVHFRSKRSMRSQAPLKVGSNQLKYVSTYRYLGVTFDEYLDFKQNAEILSASANRALGSLISKYKLNKSMGFRTYEKLFHNCVVPILDYASGVWGNGKWKEFDAVQNKAARIFLGVHKFTATASIKGDIGWNSCLLRWNCNHMRLWNRLISMNDDRLTKHVFLQDVALNSDNNWSGYCRSLFDQCNCLNLYDSLSPCCLSDCVNALERAESSNWKDDVASKPKLRTYAMIKPEFGLERYISLNLTPFQRSVLAQIRFGILPLAIETGRFTHTPVDLQYLLALQQCFY